MNIYAHRGNSGFFPENTMYAFKKSLDLGIYRHRKLMFKKLKMEF